MTVRVRFAPSPTGHLHIGGARTALFNWLFARHHGGVFVLRIEDTDRERSTEEAIQAILDSLTWLGLSWDEGPYRQTDRLELYRDHVDRLLKAGRAYRCDCSPEALEQRRREALARGEVPKYDGRCRERDIPAGRPAAIRFRALQEGETVVEDLVKGTVVFDNRQLDDLILLRSDGTPTYNLCVVVDDATMGMTHVIRGDDHLNNTPRQLQLYQALGYPPPRFAHVPMILGADRTRLSKRHGATSVSAYRDMGYLPEALVNYLARLGWSHGDQEIFSRDELVRLFRLEAVGKSAAVFNPEKLLWLNGHYMAQASGERLAELLPPFLEAQGIPGRVDPAYLARVAEALKSRSRTLAELARSARYFLLEEVEVEEKVRAKFLTPAAAPLLKALIPRLEALASFTPENLEPVFQGVVAEAGVKLGQLAQPVRVAVTGGTVSPGIYEVLALVGKERVLRRLRRALALCAP